MTTSSAAPGSPVRARAARYTDTRWRSNRIVNASRRSWWAMRRMRSASGAPDPGAGTVSPMMVGTPCASGLPWPFLTAGRRAGFISPPCSVRARRLGTGHAPPAEVRLARRGRLVQPPDGRLVGSRGHEPGLALRLGGDLDERLGERVERLERFGLGRLDQHALLHGQGEVDRRRGEALVDQPLGDVEGTYARPLPDLRGRGDELVLARAVVRDPVRVAQADAQVVRGQDRVVRDLGQPGIAMRAEIRIRAHEDAGAPGERADAADRRGPFAVALEPEDAVGLADHPRGRQVRHQVRAYPDGPRARAAAAVRRAERLVRVDVHHVEPGLARPEP